MDPNRFTQIIRRITDLTAKKELSWQPVAGKNTHFGAHLESAPVAIWSEDEDDVAPFKFSIGNEQGAEVAYITSVMGATSEAERELNKALYSLYERARS